MAGCEIIIYTYADEEAYGVIDTDPERDITHYRQLVAHDGFHALMRSKPFFQVKSFTRWGYEDEGLVGALKFVDEVTQFCRDIAKPMYDDILARKGEDKEWYKDQRHDNVFIRELRMLMHTTATTLYGMLKFAGFDVSIIRYNFSGIIPYAVRVMSFNGDTGGLTVGICPVSFVSEECKDWGAPSKIYYYEDKQRGQELDATDNIETIIALIDDSSSSGPALGSSVIAMHLGR